MGAALILVGMFGLASPQKPALPEPARPNVARVYVFTEMGGDADELEARRESVKDLSKALAGKPKQFVLVDTEDQADVVLEVIDRGITIPRVVIGLSARPGQPPEAGGPARAVHLRVRLTSGQESVALTNKNTAIQQNGGWKSAADDIARQVDKWIVDHSRRVPTR